MKNTELKNWSTEWGPRDFEKRLVWVEAPRGRMDAVKMAPKNKEAEKDELDAVNLPKEKLNKLTDRIKNLSLKNEKINIDPKGKVSADKLRQVLKKELAEMDLNIKNIDLYLLNGLLENIGKADKLPSRLDQSEITDLTKWMHANKIAKFTIDQGFWKFFDANGEPIPAEYKLDETGEKINDKDKNVNKTKSGVAVLSAEVGKRKAADKAKDELAVAADKDRLKPENLEKVTSKTLVALDKKVSLDETLKAMEAQLIEIEGGKPAIKAEELKKMLMEYINSQSLIAGKDDNEKFANFVDRITSKNRYHHIGVKNGLIEFSNMYLGTVLVPPSSNPLALVDLRKPDGKGGFGERKIYAHEILKDLADKKRLETVTKVAEKENDNKDKPTKYDATEKAVQELLKRPDSKELPIVDPRYLPAFEAISKFSASQNEIAKFEIPFNDQPLPCRFEKTNNAYLLHYNRPGTPDAYSALPITGKESLVDVKKYFIDRLNGGVMLQNIQTFNLKEKSNFKLKNYNIDIDNGPIVHRNGEIEEIEYGVNWKTGALEKDPHIFLRALPHGAIAVRVEKSNISPGQKEANKYEFVAGGYFDMLRSLTTLRALYDNPDKKKPDVQNAEAERRFFAQGPAGLNKEIENSGVAGTGKILALDSANPTVEAKLSQGYYLHFDWMEKLDPPQKIQIYKSGDKFVLAMVPDGRLLGNTDSVNKGGFAEMLNMIALQKKLLATRGGEKMLVQKVNALIADYNKQIGEGKYTIIPVNGVKITGYAGVGEAAPRVYLSFGQGMEPQAFDFNIYTKGADKVAPGIEQAVKQGYLLKADTEYAKALLPEKPREAAKKAPEKITRESAISIFRSGDESPTILPEAELKMQAILKRINANKRTDLENYLRTFYSGMNDQKLVDPIEDSILMNYAKVDPDYLQQKFGNDRGKKLDYLIGVINNPKLKDQIANAKERVITDPLEKELCSEYKAYPKVLNVLAKNFMIMTAVDSRLKDKQKINGISFKENYLLELRRTVAYLDQAGVGDDALSAFLDKNLKNAVFESLPEWNKALEKQKEADAKALAEQKELLDRKNNLNGMPFTDFEKLETMSALGSEAYSVMKGSPSIKPANIFLSKIPGNSLINNDLICFNIKTGPEKNQKAYTVNFLKEGKNTVIKIAPGWNNAEAVLNLSIEKDSTTQPDKIAYLLNNSRNLRA